MVKRELYELLDALRSVDTEHEWLEFKEAKASFDKEKLGECFSALANEATLANQGTAWLIFGIHDKKRDAAGKRLVVGTTFKAGAVALNELKKFVADHTTHRITFRDIHELTVEGERVLMFEIPPAPIGMPVPWKGHFFGREGSSIGALSLPEIDQIRNQTDDWSAELCPGATLADIDPAAIARARGNFKAKHPKLAAESDGWSDQAFLNKAKLTRSGAITRAAILLLGLPESAHFLTPADPRITWVLKNADGSNRDYHHFGPPFLLATDDVAGRIRNTNYQFMRDLTLFPTTLLQYDTWVLRELLHNCVAHQDYRLNGRITVVEHEDRLVFSNPGTFIPGSVDRVVTSGGQPPERYRNRMLVDAMVSLNMIDTVGNGIPKAFNIQRMRGFPLPDYDLSNPQSVTVTLYGKVLDENYTRALLAKTDLGLVDVIALDKVQKRFKLTDAEVASLREKQLVEGRRPNLHVSAAVAAATGKQAEYVLTAGFEDNYYKDLILKLIDKFSTASPQQIKEMLTSKLPGNLTVQQRANKVRNLVQELQREGLIENIGRHGPGAKWTRKAEKS